MRLPLKPRNMTVQSTANRPRASSCMFIGHPVTDIVAQVSENALKSLGGAVGGSALLNTEELSQLRSTLAQEATETLEVPGGSAANVATCLASLSPDAACHFTGAVGADETGERYTAALRAAAVEPHFVTAEAHPSAVSVCLVTSDGQRTMRTCLGAAMEFERGHLPTALMQSMHLLHCEGYVAYKPDVLEGVAEASSAGATFSLDMASFEVIRNCWTSLQAIIESGRVEVLFCNEDEASEIVRQYGSKEESQEDSLHQLIEHAGSILTQYCKVAVFTLGAKGAIAMSSDTTAKCKARKVTIADTVGAGDAFCGAFLATYMQGADLQACVEMGCAAGAEAVQCKGARLTELSIQSLREKLTTFTGEL